MHSKRDIDHTRCITFIRVIPRPITEWFHGHHLRLGRHHPRYWSSLVFELHALKMTQKTCLVTQVQNPVSDVMRVIKQSRCLLKIADYPYFANKMQTTNTTQHMQTTTTFIISQITISDLFFYNETNMLFKKVIICPFSGTIIWTTTHCFPMQFYVSFIKVYTITAKFCISIYTKLIKCYLSTIIKL